MINDLLWKLLGKVGIQKEGVITIGNKPTDPVKTAAAEYRAPITSKLEDYVPTPKPVAYNSRYGRIPETKSAPEPVYNAISQASNKFGVPLELLLDIAFSESSFNPQIKNEIGATGLYQFTPQTWKDVQSYANNPKMSLYGALPNQNPEDPLTNALAAAYLIKMGQLGKWDASEWNWGEKYTPKELEDLGFYKQSMYHRPGMRPTDRLKGGVQ